MSAVGYVDHLLRNREQVSSDLRSEVKTTQNTSACFRVFLLLSVFYGFVMGSQGLMHAKPDGWKFALAAAAKMPMLFLLTLGICLPLLYVLNVMIGPRARFRVVLGLLMASLAATSIVLASCAPIVAFFMISTTSYPFIKLLNVAVFVLAGGYGVWFLSKGMHDLAAVSREATSLTPAWSGVSAIMKWWLLTYGLVGTQMAWILRPFIGSPGSSFSFFRQQGSNFYVELGKTIGKLFGA